MFKCVFIPSDNDLPVIKEYQMAGGLEKDALRLSAEVYFGKVSNQASTTNEEIEAQKQEIEKMLSDQGQDINSPVS